ncbi:neuraminidase-like domain-containing protein [Chitinophaga sp. YIM B06452]|uniref:Tc toxin subunit A-related protein n=1 Tax=Chitinophaga sp. YIM B06452 TaxID=3082158 RepID=UPI0031FEF780
MKGNSNGISIASTVDDFIRNHPDFDLLSFDFCDKAETPDLPLDQPGINQLMTLQRLLRVYNDRDAANTLLSAGLDSAHAIARIPAHRFLRMYGPQFNTTEDPGIAQKIHANATAIAARVKHVFANIHGMVGSPHFNAALFNNVSDTLRQYAMDIPSYQDLFGDLDFCECEHCKSIFSPAAYFLDIMRITDDYITDPNTIPAGMTLEERRPDLFRLLLTCENTNTLIPFLQIVNAVLEARLETGLVVATGTAQGGTASTITLASTASADNNAYAGMELAITSGTGAGHKRMIQSYDGSTKVATVSEKWSVVPDNTAVYTIYQDVYHQLALAPYPFNLPFQLPLQQIRLYLGQLGTSLTDIYTNFLHPAENGIAQSGAADNIVLAKTASTADNAYNNMQVQIVSGTGKGQLRIISSYTGSTQTATVSTPWTTAPDATSQYYLTNTLYMATEQLGLSVEAYQVLLPPANVSGSVLSPYFGYKDLNDEDLVKALTPLNEFLYRTGLTRPQFVSLIVQDLSQQELSEDLANQFFINDTGEGLPYLQIVAGDDGSGNIIEKIGNLSIKRIDRLNRFIRLQQTTKWSYADMDWMMKTFSQAEISDAFIQELALAWTLQQSPQITPPVFSSFLQDMKTIGKKDDAVPMSFFDTVYNNPGLLKGKNPYNATGYTPFDPSVLHEWAISDYTGLNAEIRGRLKAALGLNDNDLTLLSNFVYCLVTADRLTPGVLPLSLANLSWLYRLSKLAALYKYSINDCLLMLSLIYFPQELNYKEPPAGALQPGVQLLLSIKETDTWLKSTNFTVAQLQYILTGQTQNKFNKGYNPNSVPSFVTKLAVLAEGSRLKSDSFVFEDIDEHESADIFDGMLKLGLINSYGITLKKTIYYSQAAAQTPIGDDAFVSADLTPEESLTAFNQLVANDPPLLVDVFTKDGIQYGYLSSAFTEYTSLSFLFASKGAGESGSISAYDGATLTATVAQAWTTIPDNTSYYQVVATANAGTAAGAVANAITLDSAASDKDNAYSGMEITITAGTGKDQVRTITAYAGATRLAEVDKNWDTIPDNTSTYAVTYVFAEGLAQGGTSTTIVLAAGSSATNDEYKGMQINIVAYPKALLKRNLVKNILLQSRRDILHAMDIFQNAFALQNKNALEELSAFLGTSPEMLTLLLPFVSSAVDLADYLDALLSPVPADAQQGFLPYLYEDSFVTDGLIDAASSKAVYDALQQHDPPYLLASVIVPGEKVRAQVSSAFTSTTSLEFLFTGDAQAIIKRERVRTLLLLSQRAFKVNTLIDSSARSVMLVTVLNLSAGETDAIFTEPSCCNIKDLKHLTLLNIQSISAYKALITILHDSSGELVRYFQMDKDGQCSGIKITTLAKLTGWDQAQLCKLINLVWPNDDINNKHSSYNTVDGIFRLMGCFNLGVKTGIDINSLLNLYNLQGLPVGTPSGLPDYANWLTYTLAAGAVLGNVNASAGDEAFAELLTGFNKKTDTQSRDALVGYTIWTLSETFHFIRMPSDLYQFLLIDVEMSACDSVSLIAQGIASVQLYMQRCRLMLEEGVTDLSNIQPVWWEWMMAYRVWEANRKIFLYPENYIDPALRRSQTAPFKQFSEAMLQSNISDAVVTAGFLDYFESFSQLASLNYCDAYNCLVDKGSKTPPEQQTFFFARTNTDPYKFYYRIYYPQSDKWEQWEEINLTINAYFITPVFAYNRLFITWTERYNTSYQQISGGSTTDEATAYKAVFNYAYYDQNKSWVQAQGINRQIVEDYYPTTYNEGSLYIDPSLINPDDLYWQKTYALRVPPKTIPGTPDTHFPERVLITLGALYNIPEFEVDPADKPVDRRENPDLHDFELAIYETTERVNAMIKKGNTRSGKIFLNNSALLFPNLQDTHQHLVILDYDELADQPRPYRPQMDLTNRILNVIESDNLIYDNYFADYVNRTVSGVMQTPSSRFALPPMTPSDNSPIPLLYNISDTKGNIITIKNQPGWFIFSNGDVSFLLKVNDENVKTLSDILIELNASISGLPDELDLRTGPYTSSEIDFNTLTFALYRLSTSTIDTMSQLLFVGGIDTLLTPETQQLPEIPVKTFYKDGTMPPPNLVIPDPATIDSLDFSGAYGIYFWEIFFHVPFLVGASLQQNQRFEEAMKWYQYVFNPTEPPDPSLGNPNDRFWRFLPFRNMTKQSLIQTLTDPATIKAYNDDPFDPDAIAALRPVAYAKSIVMKYIDNLITWGDFLFAQDTRESITSATNLYVLASDLLGQRPEVIDKCPTPKPESFNDIKASYDNKTIATGTAVSATTLSITLDSTASKEKDAYTGMYIEITDGTGMGESRYITAYDGASQTATLSKKWEATPVAGSKYRIYQQGIPQFFIRLENSAFTTGATESNQQLASVAFNNIPSYFCVPENSEFVAYWARVEDRLYKIRHCQNMQGIERQLALFEPPIDPRQLIRAAASGGGLSLTSQLEPQVPYYRFSFMIEKARALTGILMQFGSGLLAALEKKDAEALSLLKVTQEKTLLNLTTYNKQQQINELTVTGASLSESQKGAKERNTYYSNLIQTGLLPGEILNLEAMTAAMVLNVAAVVVKTMSSISYALPNVGSPFAMTYGGEQVGASASGAAEAIEVGSIVSNFVAQLSATIAGYQRREQDWELQQKLASIDEAQIGYQIMANDISKQIAEQELLIHLESIRQNEETEAFLKDKFTNEELYQWMAGRLSTVYFQTYNLAVSLARSAQRAYQYELNNNTTFINFGYWDNLQKGLLAGEGLMLAIEQMATSYIDINIRPFEIQKNISLMQLDPKALLDFINTGECMFSFSEKQFDDDYPGQYARKIKTISVSIPAVIGPYQNIKATLTQQANQIVMQPDVNAVNYLLGGSNAEVPEATVLRTNWWINQQIALSSGVNDDGLFELNFNDERYLPFEGTGAVSSWKLSMPKATNRINYSGISDVIIQLKYTAFNGGKKFADDVMALDTMKAYSGSSLFSLAQNFPAQWYSFMNVHPDDITQVLNFHLSGYIPPHVKNAKLTGLFFQLKVRDGANATGAGKYISLKLSDTVSVDFNLNAKQSFMQTFDWAIPADSVMDETLTFTLADTPADLKTKTTPAYLDPLVVEDAILVLFYDGEIQWK